jgi:hypothetical protein
MMDATSVGISPYMSSPYVTTQATTMIPDQTSYTQVGSVMPTTYEVPATTYTTGSIPATTYTTGSIPAATYTTGSVPATTYTTGSVPVFQDTTAYQIPGMVQGLEAQDVTYSTQPDAITSYIPDAGITSFAPQIAGPDQVITSLTPEVIPTTDVQTYSVVPDAGLQSVVPSVPVEVSSVVPSVVVPDTSALAVPAQTSTLVSTPMVTPPPEMPPQVPAQPNTRLIADEDFERGRPIYDEFS